MDLAEPKSSEIKKGNKLETKKEVTIDNNNKAIAVVIIDLIVNFSET